MNYQNIFNYLELATVAESAASCDKLRSLLTIEELSFIIRFSNEKRIEIVNKCKEKGVDFIQVYEMLI